LARKTSTGGNVADVGGEIRRKAFRAWSTDGHRRAGQGHAGCQQTR
jgi:hypothetical protein